MLETICCKNLRCKYNKIILSDNFNVHSRRRRMKDMVHDIRYPLKFTVSQKENLARCHVFDNTGYAAPIFTKSGQ